MPDYSLSKIYKLVSNKSPDIYIGSCTTRLSTRLSQHKCKSNGCSSKKLFEDDAIVMIVLIEDYPCENKNMLTARELHYITINECINIRKPFVCDIAYSDKKARKKEYYTANIDKIKKNKKEYRTTHKDRINAMQKARRAEKQLA